MNNKPLTVFIRSLIGELVLSFVLIMLLVVCVGADWVNSHFQQSASDGRFLMGGLLAASISIWVVLVNWSTADFGLYLRAKAVDDVLHRAFIFAIFVFFFSTCAFIFWAAIKTSPTLANGCAFLGILSTIELFSIVRNIEQLRRLHVEFRLQLARQERQDK